MDFIFMLTRQDRTVPNCLQLLDEIRPLNLRHIGFKDVGVDRATLHKLAARIRGAGAVSYMEVVSTTPEACLSSAWTAVDIGVDRLLGGTEVDAVRAILRRSPIEYFPFAGFPAGHPTALGGAPEDVEAHCRDFAGKGCAGADLLAYRATDADPLELVRAARRGLGDGTLIVAGSIASAEQIAAIAEAGADAFTVGSAAFEGSFAAEEASLPAQLASIQAHCQAASA
jgi:hypothetical protein